MVDFGTKFAKVLPPGFQMPWNKGAVSTVEALKIRQQELLQVRHYFDCELTYSDVTLTPHDGRWR